MPLSRDEVYRLIGIAKGDIPASRGQQGAAQARYDELVEQWTRQFQAALPGNLSITRESVQREVERAYRDYRRRRNHLATRRRLQDQG